MCSKVVSESLRCLAESPRIVLQSRSICCWNFSVPGCNMVVGVAAIGVCVFDGGCQSFIVRRLSFTMKGG